MRRVRFLLLPPVGSHETPTEGTVADLLDAIPYLLVTRIVPPLAVLNEVLATGEVDAGMSGGCRWEPFSLTPADFNDLVASLAARQGDTEARYVEPPAWVRTYEEWRHWTVEFCYAIPAKRNLEFSRQLSRLEREQQAADAQGDVDRAAALLSRITDLSLEHSDWIRRHRKPHVWERES
jgi:hypothetical protein